MLHRPQLFAAALVLAASSLAVAQQEPLFKEKIDVNVPPIAQDKSIQYDYDIVYVRAKRAGDEEI